jgi:hypothetical protein
MRRLSLPCVVLLLAGTISRGAELFYMDHDSVTDTYLGPVGPLVISGEIVRGDYDRLLAKIRSDEARFLAQNKIILASDGGDVAEAIRMAGLIKAMYSQVLVGPLTGRCVSACFFIYAAAQQREAGERLIGINRPYLADSDAPAAEGLALAQVRIFLKGNDVPAYLAEEMFRHASDDAYWLSAEDEKKLGFRAPAFSRYLKEKCAWDDQIERDVYAGKRSIDELKQLLACRTQVTQADARKALELTASTPRVPR